MYSLSFVSYYITVLNSRDKMKRYIIISLFTMSSAGLLPSRTYLPQEPGNGELVDTGNRRPQQETEKNAVILKQDQVIHENGNYHFGYETSNGIKAEEAGDTVNAEGGFAYKGDDGNTYSVTYTAGEGGFRAQGKHLPVSPPIPEAILEALKKNEQDEAAGIFDDGKYHPEKHGGGLNKPSFVSSNHHSSFDGYRY